MDNDWGFWDSMVLGGQVAGVDYDYSDPSVTDPAEPEKVGNPQSTWYKSTNLHAMAGRNDVNDKTKYQSAREAEIATMEIINGNNIERAIHAAQDKVTSGHRFKEWHDAGFNMVTLSHLCGDAFPSPDTLRKAAEITDEIIKRFGCP